MGEMLGGLIRNGIEVPHVKRIRRHLAGGTEGRVSETPPPPSSVLLEDTPGLYLSRREQEILALLGARLSNKEIADRLFISPVTVKRHASNIYRKLKVSSRKQATEKGIALGIIDIS